jgi:hypothetical protein
MSDKVYDVSNGDFAPKRDQSAPDHNTMSTTEPMTAANFSPTNHLMTARKRSYRPNHTSVNAATACSSPHTGSGTDGMMAAGTIALAATSALETK